MDFTDILCNISALYKPQSLIELCSNVAQLFPISERQDLPRVLRSCITISENRQKIVQLIATRILSCKESNADNIFATNPIEVLNLMYLAGDQILMNKKQTTIPPWFSNFKHTYYIYMTNSANYYYDKIKCTNLNSDDAWFTAWWYIASTTWSIDYDCKSGFTQLEILSTIMCAMFDIKLPYMKDSSQGYYIINKDGNIENQYEYIDLFMLPISCVNMIGKPERHVFSVECNCIACITNPINVNPNLNVYTSNLSLDVSDEIIFYRCTSVKLLTLVTALKALRDLFYIGILPLYVGEVFETKDSIDVPISNYYCDNLITWYRCVFGTGIYIMFKIVDKSLISDKIHSNVSQKLIQPYSKFSYEDHRCVIYDFHKYKVNIVHIHTHLHL